MTGEKRFSTPVPFSDPHIRNPTYNHTKKYSGKIRSAQLSRMKGVKHKPNPGWRHFVCRIQQVDVQAVHTEETPQSIKDKALASFVGWKLLGSHWFIINPINHREKKAETHQSEIITETIPIKWKVNRSSLAIAVIQWTDLPGWIYKEYMNTNRRKVCYWLVVRVSAGRHTSDTHETEAEDCLMNSECIYTQPGVCEFA